MLNAISREISRAASVTADAVLPTKGGDDTEPSDTAKASRDQDQDNASQAALTKPDDVTGAVFSGDTDTTPEGASSGVTAGTGNPSDPEAAAPADTAAREFIPASKLTVDDVGKAPSADEVIAAAKKAVEEDKAAASKADDGMQASDDTAGPEFTTTTKETNEAGESVLTTHTDDVKIPAPDAAAAGSRPALQQLTAGAAPLPKMAKGRSKWMNDRSAWYPDSKGVHHPPGVYIQRKPFKSWGRERPATMETV